jgi:hypothetical protein
MKKQFTLLLILIATQTMVQAQVPVNQSSKVDGLEPVIPSQAIKPGAGLSVAKTNCDVTGTGNTKFKSVALNIRNGGVWLITDKDSLTGCHFHYSGLQGTGAMQYNSTAENLTSYFGVVLVHSKNGLGMMAGGHPPPHVRKINEHFRDFPMPLTTYVYGDTEIKELWYLNENGYIKSGTSTTSASNIPPEKFAKMFTVYDRRFLMIDEFQDLYMWKPGFTRWNRMGTIKAKHLTTDPGLGTILWYVGIDDQVYYLYTEAPTPTAVNAKARSIAVFGSQLYFIGLDGYFYLRVNDKDIRVAL